MFKKILCLNQRQSKKWAESENKRPAKAIWWNRGPGSGEREQELVHDFTFNANPDGSVGYTGGPGGPLLLDLAVLNFRKRRQRASDRQKFAENWQEAKNRMADILNGHASEIVPSLCSCASREIVDVRYIELGCMYSSKTWCEMIKV